MFRAKEAAVKELMEMGTQIGDVNKMAFFKKEPRDMASYKGPNIL